MADFLLARGENIVDASLGCHLNGVLGGGQTNVPPLGQKFWHQDIVALIHREAGNGLGHVPINFWV